MTMIILHHMMVHEHLEERGSPSYDCPGGYLAQDDERSKDDSSHVHYAEKQVGVQLVEQG